MCATWGSGSGSGSAIQEFQPADRMATLGRKRAWAVLFVCCWRTCLAGVCLCCVLCVCVPWARRILPSIIPTSVRIFYPEKGVTENTVRV